MSLLYVLLLSSFAWIGCIDSPEDHSISVEAVDKPLETLSMNETVTMVDYKVADKNLKAEVLSCTQTAADKSVLILHSEYEAFPQTGLCQLWSSQVFAHAGYNIVAINRPGFGRSTGAKDFSGLASQTAILSGLKKIPMLKKAPIKVIWGYSGGSIAAAFVAKKIAGVEYLILGNGIFDTETLAAKTVADPHLQQEVQLFMETEGEDGHEVRSIEWDVEGLPQNILIYHSETNSITPFARAESFRTTLATAEYNVQLFPVKNTQHKLDWPLHQQVMRTLLDKISP